LSFATIRCAGGIVGCILGFAAGKALNCGRIGIPRRVSQSGDDLAIGRLVIALAVEYKSSEAYCLVYEAAKRNDPSLEVFRRWLLEETSRRS